jgi:predicted transcriptional regulator
MGTTTVGVKLDEEMRARLKKLGEAKRRSAHWLMKEAIARYVNFEERYEQEKVEDEARWQRYLETGAHITHAELTTWFDELADQAAGKAEAK